MNLSCHSLVIIIMTAFSKIFFYAFSKRKPRGNRMLTGGYFYLTAIPCLYHAYPAIGQI